MAYQNVGTPRFYIDHYQYLKSIGFNVGKWYNDYYTSHLQQNNYTENPNYGGNGYDFTPLKYPQAFDLNPTEQFFFDRQEGEGNNNGKWFNFAMPFLNSPTRDGQKIYAMYLNHSLYDESLLEYNGVGSDRLGMYINFQRNNGQGGVEQISAPNRVGYFNCDDSNPHLIYNNGCSIMLADVIPDEVYQFMRLGIRYSGDDSIQNNTIGHWIGGISYGFYYDMPHSPELDVTMTIENDGFDAITTQGGAHLTNVRYNGAPMWKKADGSEAPPWTIGEPTTIGRRRGRRVWSMNFRHFSEKDLFASNYMSNNYTESSDGYDSADLDTDADGNNVFYYNLDNDDSFAAQVLNKVGNGQRFIFQPDNTNNNPDQFAICQLDQKSLEINQVANGIYDISLKIREIW